MFEEEYEKMSNSARAKVNLLKNNRIGYFVLSLLAGVYIGFGVLLDFSISGALNGEAYAKIVMGAAFGIALSLVVVAGAELFTGNNLVMMTGLMKKKVTFTEMIKLFGVCYVGNWVGSILLALLYHVSGLGSGTVGEVIATAAAAKMSVAVVPLLVRGVLCNTLVCVAVWCGARCKSEGARLIMIFWCLFAFITTGFEHSVANMTLLTISLLNPCGQAVSISGYFYNIIIVTIGNMIGGIVCVALPYYLASRKK